MFLFFFGLMVVLVVAMFAVRYALSAPHGALDGTVRVVIATIFGGVMAAWIVGASTMPDLNRIAHERGDTFGMPSVAETRELLRSVQLSSPVSLDLAAAIGAGLGFFVSLASVGSYRRTA